MLFFSSSAFPASVAGARGYLKEMAEWTGLEPATPGVTGRYSNQLNYHSACWWVLRGSNPRPSPCKGDALPAELSTPWRGAEFYARGSSLASTQGAPGFNARAAGAYGTGSPVGRLCKLLGAVRLGPAGPPRSRRSIRPDGRIS